MTANQTTPQPPTEGQDANYLHVHTPCDICGECKLECEHKPETTTTTSFGARVVNALAYDSKSPTGEPEDAERKKLKAKLVGICPPLRNFSLLSYQDAIVDLILEGDHTRPVPEPKEPEDAELFDTQLMGGVARCLGMTRFEDLSDPVKLKQVESLVALFHQKFDGLQPKEVSLPVGGDLRKKLKAIHTKVYEWADSAITRDMIPRPGSEGYIEYSEEEFEEEIMQLFAA